MTRAEQRIALGADAVVSVATAVAWLPLSDPEAREWLEQYGLIRNLRGREVVIWGDILTVLRGDAGTTFALDFVDPAS